MTEEEFFGHKNFRRPLTQQIGGRHYKQLPIQPVEYIHANNIGYFEGNVIKYVSRWQTKGGIEDLKKALHYLELLIDLEKNRDKEKESDSKATRKCDFQAASSGEGQTTLAQ